MRTFIERLDRERAEALATIDGALERAGAEDRDLTDAENTMLTEARSRLERIDRERTEWTELAERRAAGDALGDRINTALVRTNSGLLVPERQSVGVLQREEVTDLWPDAGHYIRDAWLRTRGDEDATQRLDRAVANQLLADNPGIVPKPIIGPVINFVNASRPTVSSVARRPMPGSGATFSRPRITQHTLVDVQTTEKTELASRKLTITGTDVSKKTYGGTLDISFQNRDWTEPAILQIAVDDLAAQYAQQTNQAFTTAFVAAVTQTQEVGGSSSGADYLAAIGAAAATVNAAVNRMPDTIWAAPDMWAKLVSMVDGSGRPLFIAGSPSNSAGSLSMGSMSGTVFGLALVVDSALAAGTMIVGVSSLAEFYEQVGGQLSVVEPTILGIVIAYYGYVAWFVVEPNAFVKIVDVTPPA